LNFTSIHFGSSKGERKCLGLSPHPSLGWYQANPLPFLYRVITATVWKILRLLGFKSCEISGN